MAIFGVGVGFASSQLTNIILSEIPSEKTGVASGANTTVRQVGLALGIATFASLLNALTIRHATSALRASGLTEPIGALHSQGVNFAPPPGAPASTIETLRQIIESAVVAGARPALFFAAAVVAAGCGLSFLIPRVTIARESISETTVEALTAELTA
jgi:hypothetical protein